MMWWWGHDGGMGVGGWIGMIFMIIFWIAVVVGVVYLVRYLVTRSDESPREPENHAKRTEPQRPDPQRPDPLGILEDRYARGEIDREEFLQRRTDLRQKPG